MAAATAVENHRTRKMIRSVSYFFSLRDNSEVDDDHELSDWINRYNAIYEGDNVDFKPYSKRELQYYLDYDPMVGFRIAVSLGMLILLFTIFVLYKTHCHTKRNRRLIQNAQLAQNAQITPTSPSAVSPV